VANDENPFLISTPPPAPPAPPAPEEEHDEPVVDTGTFITLPPGIVDSGTLRVSSPRTERAPAPAAEPGEIVFFPVVPGIPVARIVAEPDAGETRVAPIAPASASWRIILPRSGQIVPISGALYIGRNPARTADRQDAELLAVDDPAKSLSKTHALLEVENGVLWVHDLDSTNGIFIVEPDASVIDVEPGNRAAVPAGAELELGEYVVRVEHA
jgi:hypothetical protein